MKFYTVDLSKLGLKRKVVSIDGHGWELYHGQKMKENTVVRSYPQFFTDSKEVGEVVVQETKEEEKKVVDASIVKSQKPVEKEIKIEQELVIEDINTDETPVEEETVEEETVEDIISNAKSIKTKAELEEYGLKYGIDLNKQKNMKNMIKDLESFLISK